MTSVRTIDEALARIRQGVALDAAILRCRLANDPESLRSVDRMEQVIDELARTVKGDALAMDHVLDVCELIEDEMDHVLDVCELIEKELP